MCFWLCILAFDGSILISAILTISSVNAPAVPFTLPFIHYFLGLTGSFFLSTIASSFQVSYCCLTVILPLFNRIYGYVCQIAINLKFALLWSILSGLKFQLKCKCMLFVCYFTLVFCPCVHCFTTVLWFTCIPPAFAGYLDILHRRLFYVLNFNVTINASNIFYTF